MKKLTDVSGILGLLGDHEHKGMMFADNKISIKDLAAHRMEVYNAIKEFIKTK